MQGNTPITPHPRRDRNRINMEYIYDHVRVECTNLDPEILNAVMDRLRVDYFTAGITDSSLLPLFTETGEVPLYTNSATEPKKPEWTVYEDSPLKAQKPSWTIYCDNEVNNA